MTGMRLLRVPGPVLAGLLIMTAPAFGAGDMLRDQADKACAERDFPTLFNAMALSEPVMRTYLAPDLDVSDSEGISRMLPQDYEGMPIALLDYAYVTSASLAAWQADPGAVIDYVAVEFNQSSDERWRVDWQQLSGPIIEGGDDGLQPQPVGLSGYLLFYPTHSCWQLVQDHVDTP